MVKFVNTKKDSINLDKCYDFFKNELLKAGIDAFYSELRSVMDYADDYGITDRLAVTFNYDADGRNFHIWVEGSDLVWIAWNDTEVLDASCDHEVDIVFDITDPRDETKHAVLVRLQEAFRDFLGAQKLKNLIVENGKFENDSNGSCYTYVMLDFNLIKQNIDTLSM